MTMRERLNAMDGPQQLVWVFLIWFFLFAVLWIWWDERTLPDIRGRWAGADCEEIVSGDGVSRVKRTMRVGENDWSLAIDFHLDDACAEPFHRLDIEGQYDLGPKLLDLRDATTARFDITRIEVTPLSQDAAAAFEAAGCAAGDWKVGEGQEITRLGCLGLAPTRDECPTEYDIVKIEGGKLYLGDRSLGMCDTERYPETFDKNPLRRLEPKP